MKGLFCFLLIAFALLALPQSVAASPLKYTEWTVNATFTNGDVATGFFDLDTTGTVFDWDIHVTGGNFPAVTYLTGGFETNNQFGVCSGCAHDFGFFTGPNAGRFTTFVTTTALPLTSVAPETLDSVNTLDCNNGPCHTLVSGAISGVLLPEPASTALLGLGLVGIGLMIRRRRPGSR